MWEIPLEYSAAFSKIGTWRQNDLCSGIRARVPFDGGEIVVDLDLRWRRVSAEAPGTTFAHPLDCDQWITEPVRLSREMLRCQLVLRGVPPTVDYLFRCNL